MANPENQWLIERKIHRRCLTEQRVTESDADRLGVGVVLESSLAKLATDTRLLVSTEGQLVVDHVVLVDPDGTSLEGVGDLDGGVEVGGVDSGGKTVVGVVADLDDLLLGLELADGADRAEDLLLHNLHVVLDVGEDGGLDEVSLVTLALATSLDGSTLVLTGLDVAVKECQPNVFAFEYTRNHRKLTS